MEWLTALVSLAGVAGILLSPPRRGLMIYTAVMLLYPDFMRFEIEHLEINPHRIMITLLLSMCLANPAIRGPFRWNRLDTAVLVATAVYAATLFFTMPSSSWLANRGGDTMDTLFVYLVFRLIVTDRAVLIRWIRLVAVLLVPLTVLAVCETLWGWNPYNTLANYGHHTPHNIVYEVRHGFNRAGGPSVSSIMFGLMFASFVPLIWLLRHEARWRRYCYVLCAVAVIGTLSTLSSGPYVMLMTILLCLGLERTKPLVRPLLVLLIAASLLVEIVSHRHFYDVVADRFAMDGGNAWYRSQLMRFAVMKLPEYWLVGYGMTDPGWGPLIDERSYTDTCNDYVLHAEVHGIPGLLAFLAILVIAMQVTVRAYRAWPDKWGRSFTWSLGAILTGLMFAFFTVSVFKIMITVFYIVLALQGAAYQMATAGLAGARIPLRRPARPVFIARVTT